ncbi:hypothetical protein [Mangrovitalea sediminis]|uniref:hypothetical protein n=1 Tax=Mangrovitalea sediminis TaxID=1982043 RepID=UPI000BE577EC|nr:hypothetical protein [Mangrovitalea sediminis]
MDDYFKNPILVLALGAGAGLAFWGLGAGAALAFHAFGVMIRLAISGTAAGFTIAPAVGEIASYGAAATGAALSIHLVVRITKEAKKEPLVWGTPIIGVLSGFLVQVCEQFWSGPKIVWLGFSVVTGLLVVIGGVFYGQKKCAYKIIGAVTSVVAPIAMLAAIGYSNPEHLSTFFLAGSLELWLPLTLLFIAAGILGALAHVSAKE